MSSKGQTVMTEHITWHWQDEANRIIYIKYKPGWTWAEHHIILEETLTVRETYSEDFMYVIIDMIDAIFPKGTHLNSQHRDVGQSALMVFVTNNALVRTLADVGTKIRRVEHLYRFAKTLEEANDIVQQHMETQRMKDASPL